MTEENQNEELGWRANLPEDLREDPSLVSFKDETEMINMPVTVAKSFVHARSMIGADTLKLPKTDEEWGETYKALGRPESGELYVLPTPEGMRPELQEPLQEDSKWFREIAHKAGLSDTQATTLFQEYAKRSSDTYSQILTKAEQKGLDTEVQLRTEYGTVYDGKNVLGDRALASIGGEKLMNLVRDLKLETHPDFKRFKFKLGEMLAEDLGLDKTTGDLLASPESTRDELVGLMNNPAYVDSSHPEHKHVFNKVTMLNQKLYGTKPVPVSTGSLNI